MTVITNNVRRHSGVNKIASRFILLIPRELGQHTRSKKMKTKNWEASRSCGTHSWLHDIFNKARKGYNYLTLSICACSWRTCFTLLCLFMKNLFHSFVFVQLELQNTLILSTRCLRFLKIFWKNVFLLKSLKFYNICSYFFSTTEVLN